MVLNLVRLYELVHSAATGAARRVYVTASEHNNSVTSLDIFCPVNTLDRPVCSLDKNMSSEHTEINADAQ